MIKELTFREAFENHFYSDSDYQIMWGENDEKIVFFPKKELMPMIVCEVSETQDSCKILKPTMGFPALTFDNMDFVDSFEYHLNEWARLGRLMTSLMKFVYNPDTDWVFDPEIYEEI